MDCEFYCNKNCVNGRCPYKDKDVLYCYDCIWSEVNCDECVYHNTSECKKKSQ